MVTRDGDAVLDFIETSGVWQYPLFEQHILSRLARRFASERGDAPSFTRLEPYDNWIEYASHPRRRMPDGKGDYTDWETNYTQQVSDRNLYRLVRLLDFSEDEEHLQKMLEGAVAGLSQGEPSLTVPDALYQRIDDLWTEPGGTETLARLSLLTGHQESEAIGVKMSER